MTELESEIRLSGAPNFRDIGGYPTISGGKVRLKQVYRSDTLHRLTDQEVQQFAALGIKLVCDIRSPSERAEAPNTWRERHGIAEIHIDTSAELKNANMGMLEELHTDPTPDHGRRMMLDVYRRLPHAFSGKLQTLFKRMLQGDGLPVVIHCSAGKDRTGFLCAMILFALDVPAEAIYRDYLVSGAHDRSHILRDWVGAKMARVIGAEPDPELIEVLIGTEPEYLDASLDALNSTYGSIEAYLERAAGLDRDARLELKRRLVE